jgi:hemerythrin
MEQFVWKDSFALGIDELDLQHRKLLGYLDECKQYCSTRGTPLEFKRLLDDMAAHACVHFDAEEALMREINFPGVEAHRRQHQLFRDQITALEQTASTGTRQGVSSLGAYLRDWYLQHILEQDKRFAAYTTKE